jgi:predicted porin
MKKLILASAIAALVANSATAATIYEDKGLTFKVKGDWQIQLRDNGDANEDLEVEYDDLEIKNSVTYDLGNDLQAFGQLDFGFKDAAQDANTTDGSKIEEAYIGLKSHGIAVRVGKMNLAGDEFGVEAAYEELSGALDEDMFEKNEDAGDDVIRVDAEFENITVAFSHELEAEGSTDDSDFQATDLYVGADFGPLSVAAAYQTLEQNASNAEDDTWGLSASYDAGIATIAADYSSSEDENNVETSITNLVASFKATKTTKVAVGYQNYEQDGSGDEDGWYANVSYKFPAQKNVKLFAEISDADGQDESNVLAGMQIKF